MKKILFLFLLFAAVNAHAQTDSSKIYSYGLQMRANDLEKSFPLLNSSEVYEDLFDLLKTKYKNGAPGGTSLVTLDSVRNDALIGWYTYLMQLQNGASGAWSDRIRAVLRAAPASPYVISQVNAIDAQWGAQQAAAANEGKRRYLRNRN